MHTQSTLLCSHSRHIFLLDDPPLQFGAGAEELLVFVVSWVGISVALVCLLTCLTTLCCQGALWHTDHSTIHCNLWANLIITELLFIVSAHRTQYTVRDLWLIQSRLYLKCRIMVDTDGVLKWPCFQVVCSITAGLLHFSLLSVFCWLCLEGVELCLLQREVFEGHNSRRKYFYLCGYSIPGLVVAVSAAIDFRGYGSKTA